MISDKLLLGYNDVEIQQEYSTVNHRGDVELLINGKLPIWVAPMPGLIDMTNRQLFEDSGLNTIIPRSLPLEDRKLYAKNYWTAFGIKEILECMNYELKSMNFILLDIANGSTEEFFNTANLIKSINPDGQLMGGNIANPDLMDLYMENGFDYVRVGIGGGSQCTTSILTGVHYPPISLINDCYWVRHKHSNKYVNKPVTENYRFTKIIADGGISDFGRICKALVAGADYVMIGKLVAEIEEACSPTFNSTDIVVDFNSGMTVPIKLREFYGASTRKSQVQFGKPETDRCHAEGIYSYIKVKYTLDEFISRLSQSLRSCATMIGAKSVKEFYKRGTLNRITPSSFHDFNDNKL